MYIFDGMKNSVSCEGLESWVADARVPDSLRARMIAHPAYPAAARALAANMMAAGDADKALDGIFKDAGRYVCRKYGVNFDLGRMKSDPVYNAALGAAELGGLLEDYRGSYIMTFAAYNAGRGSVKKWIDRYGDPRDPKVDAVDWVEQIPFSETRNYVQRIIENLQVYRARFGGGTRLQIEADLHRGSVE